MRARTSARRTPPTPSCRQRGESPMTPTVAVSTASTSACSVGSTRSGSASTPTTRCTASDASASRRLASRWPCRGSVFVPTSRSTAPPAEASHAPSSSAVQSCSPPPNGTSTPCPDSQSMDDPWMTPTSAGERSRIEATSFGKASASRPDASRRTSWTSCAVARRTASATGSSVVNAAVRASTPSKARRALRAATVEASNASSGSSRAISKARPGSLASGSATARSASSRSSPEGRTRTIWSGAATGRVTAPPTSRDGSWFRIARSSSWSSRPGSIPKPSMRRSRVRR